MVFNGSEINTVLKSSDAPIIAIGPDYYYSPIYSNAVQKITSSNEIQMVWNSEGPGRIIFTKQLASTIGTFSQNLSADKAIEDFTRRCLDASVGAFKDLTDSERKTSDGESSIKKRVLFFSPFGNWVVHGQLDAMLALTLQTRGAEVLVAGCNGLFDKYCYVTVHNSDQTAACAGCANTSKSLFSQFGVPLAQIRDFITPKEIEDIRSWAESLDNADLISVQYEGLPVGRWAATTTSSYFRIPPSSLNDTEVRPVFKRYIGDVLITFKAMSTLFDRFRPDQLVLFSGIAYLYAAALAVAKCRGVQVITHERGMNDGSFILLSNTSFGNPFPNFELIEAWKDVPLNVSELEEIRRYYVNRENGVGSNYAPFYSFKTDHAEVRRKLNIPPDRKIVSYFSSSEHEIVYWDGYKKLERQLELIDLLIDIFAKREEYLVIRHHPNIGGLQFGRPDYSFLSRAYSQALRAPENVRVVMPHEETTSYAILWQSDACLGTVTTMANEVAARGIPYATFDMGYMSQGVSHVISEISNGAIEKLVDDMLSFSNRIGVADLRKVYRFTNGLYRKYSSHFKNVRVENGGPWIQLQSLDELMPGKDPTLDRVCNSIMLGTSIYNFPSQEDRTRKEDEENAFFSKELNTLLEYRRNVREQTWKIPPSFDTVSIIRFATPTPLSESRFQVWTSRQRKHPDRVSSLIPDDLIDWPTQLLTAITLANESFVLIAPDEFTYDPAFIISCSESLSSQPDKNGVVWGGWLRNSTGKFFSDIFGRDTVVKNLAELQGKLPWYRGGPFLLGLALWKRDALLELLSMLSKLRNESERANNILTAFNGTKFELKRKPLIIIDVPPGS